MALTESRSRIRAVLGPTNTGKTHLAIERMLGHATGMIGFPLRLLARENYDRIVRAKGARSVALVTGEERIVPPKARWLVCTVESMPLDLEVDFLAIDEVQMAADPERGHVFTDRLLRARGREETLLLGAETVKPLIRRLVRRAEVETRPRFSTLTYSGMRKLTRLRPRTAVVAFSAAEVYHIAEMVRRQRGGAAVVLGALSPRARNAQVGLYQSGEVDYLVATDAIGMGLNMDIDHVVFAGLSKFDGRTHRSLLPAELGQIAGRAGRHMRDGTFATTQDAGLMEPEVVEAIEQHRFDAVRRIWWRSADLDFRSPEALLASLERPPDDPALALKRDAEDHLSLAALARRQEVARLAEGRDRVRLLWEVAQIPDFRKVLSESHIGMLARIFGHLCGPEERLPTDWVGRQVDALDRTEGDIETLTGRIAHVRSWAYIAHRADWLADPGHWQERARGIEDRLSDALHERLTQRFVDRRSAALIRRLDQGEPLLAAVTARGSVVVEGEPIGRLDGFRFVPDETTAGGDARAIMAAARRALREDMARRVERLEGERDGAVTLGSDGLLRWRRHAVGRLTPGAAALVPQAVPLPAELLEPVLRERVAGRLAAWLDRHLAQALGPLVRLRAAPLSGPAAGIAFQLAESLGTLPRRRVAGLVAALGKADRRLLAELGVRIGRTAVWLPALMRPRALALRALLWNVHAGAAHAPPAAQAASATAEPGLPDGFALAAGFLPAGGLLVRADALERLAADLARISRQGPFVPTPAQAARIGCPPEALAPVLRELGYRRVAEDEAGRWAWRGQSRRDRAAGEERGAAARPADPHSPFARLKGLRFGR